MRKIWFTGIFICALVLSAGAQAKGDSYVVLMSSVEAYKSGDEIPDDQNLTVPANRQLVLINAFGQTVKLLGAYTGSIQDKTGALESGQQGRSVRALASLIRSVDEDTSSVGAIRAASMKSMDQALSFNLSETGDYCYLDPQDITLERYRAETGEKAVLTDLQTGREHEITAPRAGESVPWPGDLPVAEGQRYLVVQDGKDTKTLLTVHPVTPPSDNAIDLFVSFGEAGCTEQARMVLAVIRRENR